MLSRRARPWRGIVLAACCGLPAVVWAQSAQRVQAIDLVKEASIAFEKQEFGQTVRVCRQAIKIDPTYVRAYTWLGAAYQRQGKRSDACSNYIKITKIAPNSPDARRAERGMRDLGCTGARYDIPSSGSSARSVPSRSGLRVESAAVAPAQLRPARVFNTTNGSGVMGLAFSPGAQFLSGAGSDGAWRLWSVADGRLRETHTGQPGEVSGIAASSDFYAAGSTTGEIRLFDARNGRRAGKIDGKFGVVSGLAYSRDGRYLASAGSDRALKVFDGDLLLLRVQDPRLSVFSTAFSPDARLVAASVGSEVRIYQTQTGKLVRTLRGDGLPLGALAWSRGGTLLACASQNKIRVWNPNTGTPLPVLFGHRLSVTSLAFGAGALLASAGYDGQVRLWNASKGAALSSLSYHRNFVRAVAFDATGKRLASGDQDGQIALWRLP